MHLEDIREKSIKITLNHLPSVSLAFPPVGWQRTVEQPTHKATVCAWLKTVWFYNILGILHPWNRNWGSAPGASSYVSSSPLLERDEEDPLREACSHEEVVTAGKGRQSILRWVDKQSRGPPRREGSGILKEEKRTKVFSLYFLSLSLKFSSFFFFF